MAIQLKDIELCEVSLVDKAANKKKFLFFKQEGKAAPASQYWRNLWRRGA